ncbi:MAG: discoidin domain-containing protein [Myxococcales bacterium]|nr:discoidin domain-containing protein [Myxococcales bacterium]
MERTEAEEVRGARRHRPEELADLDFTLPDPRVVWATSARASSEWGSSYAASAACGPPVVYPRGGDEDGTWLADSDDSAPWIELDFPAVSSVRGIVVLETCGPGAVFEIRDAMRDVVLWAAPPAPLADSRSARLLHVPLPPDTDVPTRLRLSVAPYDVGDEYHEIDAVALLTEPLDALRASTPSAPEATPATAPWRGPPLEDTGAPTAPDVATVLEGTLIGATPTSPFVHAILRRASGGRAANHGGPLSLRLPTGELVRVEVGRTAIFGGSFVKRRGAWSKLRAEVPWLAAAFADAPPACGIVWALTHIPLFALVGTVEGGRASAIALWVPVGLTLPFALVRVALLSLRHGRSTLISLGLVLARTGRAVVGRRGRFRGRLAAGHPWTRKEDYAQLSEHLGTEAYTDEEGQQQTRERYRMWTEREVDTSGPWELVLALDDPPRTVRATTRPLTTDVGMHPTLEERPPRAAYARFTGEHGEGDEATFVGVVEHVAEDGTIRLRASHVVLGPWPALVWKTFGVLAALLSLPALVGLLFWLAT